MHTKKNLNKSEKKHMEGQNWLMKTILQSKSLKKQKCVKFQWSTGCVRSKWTKLNSYFRQKTCRKFYSNGIFIITRSWHLICHHKNSEKNYTSPSKSLSKLDFPFWNNCFLLVLCTVCYEFYSDFECLIWFFSEFLWFDMHDLLIIKIPFE